MTAESITTTPTGQAEVTGVGACGCWGCLSHVPGPVDGLPITASRMILCPTCGNKRCPRATHHDNRCTGSNEPGQAGSRYQYVTDHALCFFAAVRCDVCGGGGE